MNLASYFTTDPMAFIVVALLFGLVIGSFLNVVIYRLPVMLSARWEKECAEMSGKEMPGDSKPFNLCHPHSTCPHCDHRIRAWENIPVLSWLALRGKCSNCHKPISLRYPAIELLAGALAALVAWRYGYGAQALVLIVLAWALIALTFIDVDHQLLPDVIVLPFLWLGLLINTQSVFASLPDAVIGAVAGYLSLWLVFHAFKLITGKEGMGYGDFKLFALFGAWLGWQLLPLIILLASLVGAIVGIAMIAALGRDRRLPIPFGPYLCAAGLLAALWGHDLTAWYLQFARIS
jgi:leader peptidase (prepilin peptidase)/N-methyltransferase